MARTGRFAELRSLPQELQDEIDARLGGGTNAREVVTFLQQEMKVLTDKNPDSLKKMLERYRSSDLREKVTSAFVEATKGVSTQKIVTNLNAMAELQTLAATQKGRFEKILATESKNDGFVLKQASEEAKLLKEMLVELGKLQLETGVLKRAPKVISGQTVDADGNATNFEWTEEQGELYRTLENIDPNAVLELPSSVN